MQVSKTGLSPSSALWGRPGRLVAPSSGGWTPASLGANLKGWWKADAGVRARTAAQFTAANSERLSIADGSQSGLDPLTSDFSVALWVLGDSFSGFMSLVGKGGTSDSPGAPGYWLSLPSATQIRADFSDGSAGRITSTFAVSALSTATWYHLVYVFDRDGNLEVFLNGASAGTNAISTQAGSVNSTAEFDLGSSSSGTLFHNGRMGNASFWNKKLDSTEIATLYNSGSGVRYSDYAGSKTNLVSWWELDENSGTRADKHGSNTLTDNNTVTAADGKVDYEAATTDVLWKWIDQSATGLLPVQVTQANKPTLVANVVNGRAVVRGDGAGDTLKVATGAISNQPLWGWCVVDDNDASTRYYFDGGAASKVALRHDGTNLEVNAGSDVGGAHTAGDFHLVTFSVNGASSEIWVDGTSLATGDAGAQNQDSGIALFADNAGASSLAGDIAELALASGSPTAADLAGLKAYITTRYGLTVA